MVQIVRHKPDVVQVLLDAGADTEFTNVWGEPPAARPPPTAPLYRTHVGHLWRVQAATRCSSRHGRDSLR